MTRPIVGVLGGGQLGRMLALAGYPLGLEFRFYDHAPEAPAGQVASLVVGEFSDSERLADFATGLTVATFEFENVPVTAVEGIADKAPVFPSTRALEITQDRLTEKQFLQGLGIDTAPFREVSGEAELTTAVSEIGTPAILKTRRLGYDGKGQFRLTESGRSAEAWAAIGKQPAILEGFVDFAREVSLVAVRGRTGETAFYPLVENHHEHGILSRSIAPAPGASPAMQMLAEDVATRVLLQLDYVGVLAIEFFQVGENLVVNEMAPRVHNSGHWSIEGAVTSQFENHLRAILGLPLGNTAMRGASLMLNCIGTMPAAAEVLAMPGAHLHDYGKAPRAGRKVGHVTVCRERMDEELLGITLPPH